MSHYDYVLSREIWASDPPFAALIMAAYRKADTSNAAALARTFPGIVTELAARYHAPEGVLPGEQVDR